jgi:hypothetical protein
VLNPPPKKAACAAAALAQKNSNKAKQGHFLLHSIAVYKRSYNALTKHAAYTEA